MCRILMFLVKLFQVFLHNTLNIGINGTVYRVAVHCRLDRTFQIGIIIQITVLSSGGSVQDIIVILFQSVLSFIVRSGKSDHICRQRTVWIDSLIFLFKPDTADLAILQSCRLESADLVISHPPKRHIPGRFGMRCYILPHRRHVQIREIRSQRFHGGFQIILPVQHYPGIYDQVIHLFTDGKLRSLGIHDVTTSKRQGDGIVFLLGEHLLLIVSSVRSHDP